MADQYLNIPEENWKPIPNFPGYDISDQGRVRSYWHIKIIRCAITGKITGTEYVLEPFPNKTLRPSLTRNRPSVTLTINNRHFYRCVYRLVLEAFVGPRPAGMECRHLDGNPTNCFLKNLVWGTHSENMLDKTRHGTRHDSKGMKQPLSKLTDDQVLEIRNLAHLGIISQEEIGKTYEVSQSHVSRIHSRDVWKHI